MGQVLERQPSQKQRPLGRIRVQLKSEVKELSGGETHLQEILLMVDRVFRKAWRVGFRRWKLWVIWIQKGMRGDYRAGEEWGFSNQTWTETKAFIRLVLVDSK